MNQTTREHFSVLWPLDWVSKYGNILYYMDCFNYVFIFIFHL